MGATVPFTIPGFKYSLDAAADLSAGQYRAVVIDANGEAARAALNGDVAGVQQNKPSAQGQACEIQQTGISKISLGATVVAGDDLSVDANGQFVPTPGTVGVVPVGKAIVGGAVNEIGCALLYGCPGTINAGT